MPLGCCWVADELLVDVKVDPYILSLPSSDWRIVIRTQLLLYWITKCKDLNTCCKKNLRSHAQFFSMCPFFLWIFFWKRSLSLFFESSQHFSNSYFRQYGLKCSGRCACVHSLTASWAHCHLRHWQPTIHIINLMPQLLIAYLLPTQLATDGIWETQLMHHVHENKRY